MASLRIILSAESNSESNAISARRDFFDFRYRLLDVYATISIANGTVQTLDRTIAGRATGLSGRIGHGQNQLI